MRVDYQQVSLFSYPVGILLLETEADKFPTGISDAARKLYVTGWTGALAAAKDLSCYQMWCCCCKQLSTLQGKLDALSKCSAING